MSVRFFFSSTLLANFFYNFFPFTCQAGWCRVFPVTLKRHRDPVNKCRNLLWTTEIQNEETMHLESKLGRGDWPQNKSRLRCQDYLQKPVITQKVHYWNWGKSPVVQLQTSAIQYKFKKRYLWPSGLNDYQFIQILRSGRLCLWNQCMWSIHLP